MFKRFSIFSIYLFLVFIVSAEEIKWLTTYPAALRHAAAEKKKIFLLFTGSDWCPGCMELEKTVLSSDMFKKFAAAKLIPVMVDFPKHKRQLPILKERNEKLATQFGVEGYPTIILLDDQGKEINRIDFTGQSPEEFIEEIEQTPLDIPKDFSNADSGDKFAAAKLVASITFPSASQAKTQWDYLRLKYQWLKKNLVDAPLATQKISPEIAGWLDERLKYFCYQPANKEYSALMEEGNKIYAKDGKDSPYFLPVFLLSSDEWDRKIKRKIALQTRTVLEKCKNVPPFIWVIFAVATDRDVSPCLNKGIANGEFNEAPPQLLYRYLDDYRNEDSANFDDALSQLKKTPIDPWVATMLQGDIEWKKAWKARGSGYANTVSNTGWEGFHFHGEAAYKHYCKAYEMHPEWPEAAAQLIDVCNGLSKDKERVQWLNRALKAQVDFRPIYQNFSWSLRPRWGGSWTEMLAFGRCAAKVDDALYHTQVPLAQIWAVQDIAGEMTFIERRAFLKKMLPEVKATLEKKIAAANKFGDMSAANHTTAILGKHQFLCGEYAAAQKTFESLKWNDNGRNNLCAPNEFMNISLPDMLNEIALCSGPFEQAAKSANALLDEGNAEAAAREYVNALANTKDLNQRNFLINRATQLFLHNNTDLPPTKEDTGIFLLARYGSIDGVKALLDAGCDVNARGSQGCTLLQRSLYSDWDAKEKRNYADRKIAMLKLLLERGANINELADPKWTALHVAISQKLPIPVAGFILQHKGIDINAGDCDKETALMFCAMLDLVEHARFLLDYGADPNRKANNGKTALDHAQSDKMRELLTARGGKYGK